MKIFNVKAAEIVGRKIKILDDNKIGIIIDFDNRLESATFKVTYPYVQAPTWWMYSRDFKIERIRCPNYINNLNINKK